MTIENSSGTSTFYALQIVFFSVYIIAIFKNKQNKYKLILSQIIYLILLIHLLQKESFTKIPHKELSPREITLEIIPKVKLTNKFSFDTNKDKYFGYIVKSPEFAKDIEYEKVYFDLLNNGNNDLINNIIIIKGIIKKRYSNGNFYYDLRRTELLKIKDADWISKNTTKKVITYINTLFKNTCKENEDVSGFLHAIFLGDKTKLSKEQENIFQKSGTMHLFAVSGLHIVFLYSIFYLLFFSLNKNRLICTVLTLIIILFYVNLIGYPPSAVRAFLMITLWQITKIVSKKTNLLSNLGWACLVILIVNPEDLFNLGFQLSFTVVFALILFFRNQNNIFNIQKGKYFNWVISSAKTSYAAFCGSIILIFDNFDIFVPGSIIINVITVPLAMLAIFLINIHIFINILTDFTFIENIILYLYNIIKFITNLLSFNKITYFTIKNYSEINDFIHIIYPFFLYITFNITKNFKAKVLLYILLPAILIFLFHAIQKI